MISGGESGDRERGIRPRQYRLPGQTRLGRVRLQVADLDRSLRFYERVLGLRVITRSAETVTLGPHDDDRDALGFDKVVWSYPGALFLSAGGYHHHLGTNTWAARAAPATDDDARLLEWEIVVPTAPDAERAAASLEAAGYTVRGDGKTWQTVDPWGTTLRLVPES